MSEILPYFDLGNTRFASIDHRNQQYSIYAITDSAGAVSERYAYTAYGQPSFSWKNIFVRWSPWLVALALFQLIPLGLAGPFFYAAFATLIIGLHAYRLRGWRFRQNHLASPTTVLLK